MADSSILANEFIKTLSQFKKIGFPRNDKFPLRQSEYMLMFALANCLECDSAGVMASDLSEKLNITPGAVTHMINSLEKEGCLERVDDKTDRRKVLIKPTEKGNEVIKMMNEMFFEGMKELIGFLGEEDTKEFIRLLSKAMSFISEKHNSNE